MTASASHRAASAAKYRFGKGKKKEGTASKYITRTKAVRYLQVSLSTFRQLCILKGVFPRNPKKKLEGNHKTYYHMKDIQFIAHDPMVQYYRDKASHMKKIRKAASKRNRNLENRLLDSIPHYKLDRLVLERYPTFIDALRDLDDCLTMVHLFATLPAVEGEQIQVNTIHNCQRLSHEWQAYISRTHSLRKTFVSVKGIYYQAEVQGQKITWLTPHALQQVITEDVDLKVMLTFLEFYEALLGFVNFKLYHTINVNYPPIMNSRPEDLTVELYALYRCMSGKIGSQAIVPLSTSLAEKNEGVDGTSLLSEAELSDQSLAQKELQASAVEPGTVMHMVAATMQVVDEDKDTAECRNLFSGMKFFLSREVPRESLLFVILAFGGIAAWEGKGSPLPETDEEITHQIVDRPTQGHIFLSRNYVQPQWVYDCVNARIILPTENYLVGRVPPPHLSPFVDNEEEGYVPEYAQTIKRLQAAASNNVLPLPGVDDELDKAENLLVEGILERTEANEAAQKKRKLATLEKQYHDDLRKELEGTTYFSSLSAKNTEGPKDADMETGDATPEDDDARLTKSVMSRRDRGLLEAIEIGKERKRAKNKLLLERKSKVQAKQQ